MTTDPTPSTEQQEQQEQQPQDTVQPYRDDPAQSDPALLAPSDSQNPSATAKLSHAIYILTFLSLYLDVAAGVITIATLILLPFSDKHRLSLPWDLRMALGPLVFGVSSFPSLNCSCLEPCFPPASFFPLCNHMRPILPCHASESLTSLLLATLPQPQTNPHLRASLPSSSAPSTSIAYDTDALSHPSPSIWSSISSYSSLSSQMPFRLSTA